MMAMERKQIQFTRQQIAALRREARRRGTSESAIVREALDAWLGTSPGRATPERIARALAVAGLFRSGRHDIATEHDRELADITYEHINGASPHDRSRDSA